ncbi:MAG TPA: sulfotransferase [Candidatus Baltobacteraceae bacterium]|nr:sulfotransferase [Candidatus Baltobacteraceae bacterium]
MTRSYLPPIFIVGQYKCGTSWLARILSAHPEVIGVHEIDIVDASCKVKNGAVTLAPMQQRLDRFFDKADWCNDYTPSGWEYADVVARFERGEEIPTRSWDRSKPLKFMHLRAETARWLYNEIKAAAAPEQAMNAFLTAVCANAERESHIVLKAADQLWNFDILQSWQPNAKKIAITRDGRDASISARHFQDLMREVKPSRGVPRIHAYLDLLRKWADRADRAITAAGRGRLYVLRYEDLTNDYTATLTRLLDWLELPHSQPLIDTIQKQTCFETLTGRARGVEAKGFIRKGAVGEWRHVFSVPEQEQAWRVAGEQLSALGYTREGTLRPLPDLSNANEYPYRLERNLQLQQKVAALRARLRLAEAQVREFKSLSKKKVSPGARWTRPLQATLRAARKATKHLARFFVSTITFATPSCSDALSIGW